MESITYPQDRLFLNPPLKVIFSSLFFGILGICLLFRISEMGASHVKQACRISLWASGAAGLCGVYSTMIALTARGANVMTGVLTGGLVRMLIGICGFALILFFTDHNPVWLILFFFVQYLLFLWIDTYLAIGIMNHRGWDREEFEKDDFSWKPFGSR